MTDYTPEQIEEARTIVAAAEKKARDEAEAQRLAYLAPVTNLVTGDAFKAVLSEVRAMREAYEDNGSFSVHVNALSEIMPRLAQAAGINLDVVSADSSEEPAASAE